MGVDLQLPLPLPGVGVGVVVGVDIQLPLPLPLPGVCVGVRVGVVLPLPLPLPGDCVGVGVGVISPSPSPTPITVRWLILYGIAYFGSKLTSSGARNLGPPVLLYSVSKFLGLFIVQGRGREPVPPCEACRRVPEWGEVRREGIPHGRRIELY